MIKKLFIFSKESIDDLIRQVLKYIYNVDINNMPLTSGNDFEQKRKLKKKMLYSASGTPVPASAPSASSGAASVQQSPLFPVRSAALQQPAHQAHAASRDLDRYKPRSKTEIYSSGANVSLPGPSAQPTRAANTSANPASSLIGGGQPALPSNPSSSSSLATLIKSSMNLSQNNVASQAGITTQQQMTNSSSSMSNGGAVQQPVLTRHRKFENVLLV